MLVSRGPILYSFTPCYQDTRVLIGFLQRLSKQTDMCISKIITSPRRPMRGKQVSFYILNCHIYCLGFIPGLSARIGQRYTVLATEGLADFEREQLRVKTTLNRLRKTIDVQSGRAEPRNLEERLVREKDPRYGNARHLTSKWRALVIWDLSS